MNADTMTLSRKLIGLVGLLLCFMALLTGIGIWQLRSAASAQRDMYQVTVLPLRQVVDGGRQAAVHFRRLYPYILKTDASSRTAITEQNGKSEEAVLTAIELLTSKSPTGELRAAGAKVREAWTSYRASVQVLMATADSGDAEGAMDELKAHTDALHVTVRNALVEAGKLQEAYAKGQTEVLAAQVDETAKVMLGLLGLALVAGGLLGVRITRSVLRQLGGEVADAVQVARRIAQGDLGGSVPVRAGDQDSLMHHLATMSRQLAGVISRVRESAASVATASTEISLGTNDLSTRTEQQASSLQEAAASMSQLGDAARHNADSARTANELSQRASSVAGSVGEVVNEVVSTMRDINQSSGRIADIIGVIDGIAFQTNILALNAAVEAARAGEQGRGFAVVASEVRGLAQRSAAAAKEIKSLIVASGERVTHGSAIVDKAGVTMNEMVQAILRVTEIVSEITASSHGQSQGVGQISEAVAQMDRSTQQNSALVEQSAAACESLRQQAQQLVQIVSVFKLDERQRVSA